MLFRTILIAAIIVVALIIAIPAVYRWHQRSVIRTNMHNARSAMSEGNYTYYAENEKDTVIYAFAIDESRCTKVSGNVKLIKGMTDLTSYGIAKEDDVRNWDDENQDGDLYNIMADQVYGTWYMKISGQNSQAIELIGCK